MESLPDAQKLTYLFADNNLLSMLPTFPDLQTAYVSHNRLKIIHDQPNMDKIHANNNMIVSRNNAITKTTRC